MNIFHVKSFLFHSTSSSQVKIFDLLCVCKKISLSVYLRIFNAFIASIFPNNSEPCALKKKEAQKIDTFHINFLRQTIRNKRRIKKKHQLVQTMQNRTLDYTYIQEKKTQMIWAPTETPKRSACEKSL